MQAFEVFYAQTERAVNYLYILVICILPLLWFGDCKKTMSLLFKKIVPPNYKEYDIEWDFSRNLQLVLITFGVGLFFLHRTWRLRLQEERCDRIKLESAFTETHELHQLKLKLLQAMDKITMEKILQPKSSEPKPNPIWKPIKRPFYPMQEEEEG